MKRVAFGGIVFSLTLIAFSAVGVKYLNIVFDTSTRWIFLALLASVLLLRGQQFFLFTSRFGPVLGLYFLWCLLTALWSLVPLLSFMKATAFMIIAVSFVTAGQVWVQTWKGENTLGYLLPVVLMTLFAGLFAPGGGGVETEGLTIYRGLTGNPNYLGILVASSLPYALLLAYRSFRNDRPPWVKTVSISLIGALVTLLWMSGSRSATLCALVISLSFFLSLNQSKQVTSIIVAIALGAGALLVAPEIERGVYQRVVVKSTSGSDIFFSRRQTWDISAVAAEQGEIAGLGYGASAGATSFDWSLTSNRYGREKGNTVLAVMEETGVIGLAIYVAAILSIFTELFRGLRRCPDSEGRVELSLLIGFIAGLIVQSMFEAWWSSPGSVESALFWSALGVASGLAKRGAEESSLSFIERDRLVDVSADLVGRRIRTGSD
ncbi:MAG: O-antigen ligase family protein [Proteobacteria bacterium]|nr:O-antigen ligase family protein [Pseudomonadota bacterium]